MQFYQQKLNLISVNIMKEKFELLKVNILEIDKLVISQLQIYNQLY